MNRTRLIFGTIGATISLVCGCGFEAGPSAFDEQELEESGNQDNQPQADELGEGSGAGTMTGTWLHMHVASSCILGQEQVSTAFYLIDIEEDGAGLVEDRRLCDLNLSPLLGFRPVASQEVLESVEFPRVDRGMITNLLEGGVYVSSTEVGLWGVELDEPVSEALPVDPEDDRVIDSDGDGNPGVSLELEGSGCARFMG